MGKKKNKNLPEVPRSMTFVFLSNTESISAYHQACEIVKDKFFMEPEGIVSIAGTRVTVPDWFPFSPKSNLSLKK